MTKFKRKSYLFYAIPIVSKKQKNQYHSMPDLTKMQVFYNYAQYFTQGELDILYIKSRTDFSAASWKQLFRIILASLPG
jgi:hypothetical protein